MEVLKETRILFSKEPYSDFLPAFVELYNKQNCSITGGILSLCGGRWLSRGEIQPTGDCKEKGRESIKTRPGKIWSGVHSDQRWKKEFEVLQLRRL